jgi:hypothetical protein
MFVVNTEVKCILKERTQSPNMHLRRINSMWQIVVMEIESAVEVQFTGN